MCSYQDIEPIGRLEAQITELAAQIHAATCRWLSLVAEFDQRAGWAPWGARSCAHWISWRCSIAPAAAREHVRVARRLQDLPLIRAAFAEGRLSYSKVRALTRMEQPEREGELLELARIATASQLERLVRGYRRVVATERAAAGGGSARWVRWSEEDDGSLLITARLPAEDGAVVLKALEAAADQLETGGEGASAEASAPPPPARPQRRADAVVLLADSFLAHGPEARRGDRYQVVVHVDAEAIGGHGDGRLELEDGTPLAPETARRLACDAAIVPVLERGGRPLSVGRKTRAIPAALRRALAGRDRCCRFPGCCEHHFVDAHHVEHWAHGGQTSLTNLVLLCRFHHRLLHEGGYSLEQARSGRLDFRRADGRRIRQVPANGAAAALSTRALERNACVPRWTGEPLDLGLGVEALLRMAPVGEAPGI
jgi:hypothetical protein